MQTATTSAAIETLNDLVAIHNDRIAGYENAIDELKNENSDLKPLFENLIDESRKIRVDLAGEVRSLGGEVETGTTFGGKLYRAWMDVKTVFTGKDRHAVLANCERGEDAAQDAYKSALKEDLPGYIRTMLETQQRTLKNAHDQIRNLRDASK